MLRLDDPGLDARAMEILTTYQDTVDHAGSYREQVLAAKREFKRRNTKRNPAFKHVRTALDAMCSGARRCGYCEDSAADEVEHIWPKDMYPEVVFAWSNYLYACGLCNGPKNNRFAVFPAGDAGRVVDVSRRRDAPVAPPIPGRGVLIDPRHEDPLQVMTLDLRETFFFVPLAPDGSEEKIRAQYTIELLNLNARDYLPKARRAAYVCFRALLRDYARDKANGASAADLASQRTSFRHQPHRTVWSEMQRQHARIDELRPVFEACPEALDWRL